MTDWAGTASILLRLHNVMDGAFRVLRSRLPEELQPQGPEVRLFEGFDGTGGAGAYLPVIARHQDGRQLSWQLEIWIDRYPDGGDWYATVKGEIDLDDDHGDDHCVLNEQRAVDNANDAADAIRELAALVVDYPIPELLAMRWPPDAPEVDDASDNPIGSFTKIDVTIRQDDVDHRSRSGSPPPFRHASGHAAVRAALICPRSSRFACTHLPQSGRAYLRMPASATGCSLQPGGLACA
jgi:hypothetical protein